MSEKRKKRFEEDVYDNPMHRFSNNDESSDRQKKDNNRDNNNNQKQNNQNNANTDNDTSGGNSSSGTGSNNFGETGEGASSGVNASAGAGEGAGAAAGAEASASAGGAAASGSAAGGGAAASAGGAAAGGGAAAVGLPVIAIILIIIVVLFLIYAVAAVIVLTPNWSIKLAEAFASSKEIASEILDNFYDKDASEYEDIAELTYDDVIANVYDKVNKKCNVAYNNTIYEICEEIVGEDADTPQYDYFLSMATINEDVSKSITDDSLLLLSALSAKYDYLNLSNEEALGFLMEKIDELDYDNLYSWSYIQKQRNRTDKIRVYNYAFYDTISYTENGETKQIDVYCAVFSDGFPGYTEYEQEITTDEYTKLNMSIYTSLGNTMMPYMAADEDGNSVPCFVTKTGNQITKSPVTDTVKYLDIQINKPSESKLYEIAGVDPELKYIEDGTFEEVSEDDKEITTVKDMTEIRKEVILCYIEDYLKMYNYQRSAYTSEQILLMLKAIEKGNSCLNPDDAYYANSDLIEDVTDKSIKISNSRRKIIATSLALVNAIHYENSALPSNKGWNERWTNSTNGLGSCGFIQWVYMTSQTVPEKKSIYLSTAKGIEENCTEIKEEELIPGDIGLLFKSNDETNYDSDNIAGIYLGKNEDDEQIWISCSDYFDTVSVYKIENESNNIITGDGFKNNMSGNEIYVDMMNKGHIFKYFYRVSGIDNKKDYSETIDIFIPSYVFKMSFYHYDDRYVLAQYMDLGGKKLGTDVKIALAQIALNRANSDIKFKSGDFYSYVGKSALKDAVGSIIKDDLLRRTYSDGEVKDSKIKFSNVLSVQPSISSLVLSNEVIEGEKNVLKSIAFKYSTPDGFNNDYVALNDIKNIKNLYYFYYDTTNDPEVVYKGSQYVVVNTVVFTDREFENIYED